MQITYHQSALNQRVAKEVDGEVVEKYLWKDLTTLLAVYDANDNLLQRFTYTSNRMPTSMSTTTGIYYLHFDQVGTLRLVSNQQSQVVKEITYDTFGTILSDTNTSLNIPFGFAGGLHDRDTNLVHFGYREYDPQTAKWTAKDPIDFSGGDSNLYGYVLGDPVGFVDPTGLIFWEPTNMGPNSMVIIDKNGNKSVYDFDTGKSKPYWDKKKTYCDTGKNDFEDSENAKQNDLDRTSRDYRLKPRGKRSEYLESLWDSLAAMFG